MQGQGSVLYFQPKTATPSELKYAAAHRVREQRIAEAARKLVVAIEAPPIVEEARAPESPSDWAARQVDKFQPVKEPWFAIDDEIMPIERRRPSVEEIQRAVANYYAISRNDILSIRRTLNVVRPRQAAIYLARKMTLRSMPEIGRKFGNRDHTTVLHSVRKIEELIEAGDSIGSDITEIRDRIEEKL